jgi:hypothetical protein
MHRASLTRQHREFLPKASPSSGPVFGKKREAHVVAPAAADFHVAARVTFAHEADALDERERAGIAGLDVRFDPMQTLEPKRVVEAERQRLRHVARARHAGKRVIAEVSALEGAADDLGEIHDAGERAVVAANDEECDVARRVAGEAMTLEIRRVRGRRERRMDPAAVE